MKKGLLLILILIASYVHATDKNTVILAGSSSTELAHNIADYLHLPLCQATVDKFSEITIPEDEYTEEMAITVDISGETTIEKDSNTEYAFSGDLSIDIEGVNMYMLGIPDTISVDITVSADVLFGDLETIEDDDDWNDVYDQDWGDIDDLMNGLNNLPFDLPF